MFLRFSSETTDEMELRQNLSSPKDIPHNIACKDFTNKKEPSLMILDGNRHDIKMVSTRATLRT